MNEFGQKGKICLGTALVSPEEASALTDHDSIREAITAVI
jgi:hypothetical protein